MADIFSAKEARRLLKKKFVLMMGDSNMRSLYKDLIYLLVEGGVTPAHVFRRGSSRKLPFCGDTVVDISPHDTAGRDFFEIREFKDEDLMVRFHFITRVYSNIVRQELRAIEDGVVPTPHVVIINSCLWDITRWGAMKEDQYKEEMVDLFQHLRRLLPDDTLIMWTSSLPIATERVKGGVFIKQLEFMKHSMRFIVLEANKFAQQLCMAFDIDFLDLHYHMRFQLHRRTIDGLHWEPPSVRHMSNLILTHAALNWERHLPRNFGGALAGRAKARAEEASIDNKGEFMLDEKILQYLQKSTGKGPGKRGKGSSEDSVIDQVQKQEPKKQPRKRVKIRARRSQTQSRTRALGNFSIDKKNVKQKLEANGNDNASFSGGYRQQHPSFCVEPKDGSSTSGTGGWDKMARREMSEVNGEVRGAAARLLVSATGRGRDVTVYASNGTQQFPSQITNALGTQGNPAIWTNTPSLNTSHHNLLCNPTSLVTRTVHASAGQHTRISKCVNPNFPLQQSTYHQSYHQFNTHIPHPFWHNYPISHFPWNNRR